MEYTEEQKKDFIREFARRKSLQLKVTLPIVLAALAMVAISQNAQTPVLGIAPEIVGPVFFGVVVLALLFSLYNWRCPACNKYLGKGIPAFCPKCGVALKD